MAAKAINNKTARQEVEKWLDFKRVKAKKRQESEDSIESMIESFEDGTLVLKEDHSIDMKLTFEVGNDKEIKTLNFKPRLTTGEITKRLKVLKNPTTDERIMAYISALTGQNTAILSELDTEDSRIAQNISIFFF